MVSSEDGPEEEGLDEVLGSEDLGVEEEGLHELFHRLWSKAVGQDHYKKHEWIQLEQAIFSLLGSSQVGEIEPPPYKNGATPA